MRAAFFSAYGRADVAYRMLLGKKFPSWLYFFEVGLTETPESWDAVIANRLGGKDIPEGALATRLSVYNILGTVTGWFYKHIGGIQPDEEAPGFKNILIKPQIGGGISCASTTYDSINGTVATHWWIKEDEIGSNPNELHIKVTVPINATAQVYIPGLDPSVIYEGSTGDKVAYLADGVILTDEIEEKNTFVYEVESGTYHFRSVSDELFPFSCQNHCRDCLDCEADDGSKPCHDCNPSCNPQQP